MFFTSVQLKALADLNFEIAKGMFLASFTLPLFQIWIIDIVRVWVMITGAILFTLAGLKLLEKEAYV